MMKKQTIAAASAVAFLLVTVLGAFGAGEAEPATQGEIMTIVWHDPADPENPPWILGELEKKFNVKIVPNGVPNEREKLQLMLASGEFPDCGGGLPEQAYKLYQDGVIQAIPISTVRRYAPGFARVANSYGYAWMRIANPDDDSEILGFPNITANVAGPNWFLAFRKDLAEKAGLTVPNWDKKVSLDNVGEVFFLDERLPWEWFHDYLIAHRDSDLDGNGKLDSVGLSGIKLVHPWSFEPFANMFGFSMGKNLKENGRTVDSYISIRYRDFLKWAQDLYNENLIDKEFPTLDVRKMWEKQTMGQVAIAVAPAGYAQLNGEHVGPPSNLASAADVANGAETALVWPPVGPTGIAANGIYSEFVVGTPGWFINRKVSEEKLQVILQIFDYIKYDPVGSVLARYGKPGVHFDWEGEEWNSSALARKPEDVPAGYPTKGGMFQYPYAYTTDYVKFLWNGKINAFHAKYILTGTGQEHAIRSFRTDLFGETNLAKVNAEYSSTVNAIRDEFYFKAITGEIDIDAEWDAYVRAWLSNGGSMILAELEKAPKVEGLLRGERVY